MTTSATTTTTASLALTPGASFLPWINRGLESLWLLAVFLVPLTFLSQDYAISEAQIAYVEVPKVALLRTLASLIFLLWSVEWAIRSRAFEGFSQPFSVSNISSKISPRNVLSAIRAWLKVHPSRWLLLAAALFFGSTFLSTVLSGSLTTSIWGEIPGQDGYSAYTIASYGILFGVIATHLKTPAQLGRLLGAVVLTGVLVGLYGIFQHFGHDFLNVSESSGGGASGRVTAFQGNAILAGAVLSMTVPVTLVASAIHMRDDGWANWSFLSKIGQVEKDTVATFLWAILLAVQLLGLMFTFSRGPWAGAVLALAVFLGLIALSLGWRMVIRTGLVLALTGVLAVALLHWQGSVSIINAGPWLGIPLVLLALAGAYATLFIIAKFERAIVLIVVAGAVVVVVGTAVLGPLVLSGRGSAPSPGRDTDATASQVSERIASIKTEVLGGFVGGRGTHWKVSWTLIKERPWFEFDDLSLSWLRPLIGYGPDLFRYTYLLESPADGPSLFPLEPDHAHNFFIHQTVEQGVIGGLASLALFGSEFGIVVHHIFRRRKTGSPLYRLLLLGLMAVIAGRFLEMMVGVARISDLTVLWVIFGMIAASSSYDDGSQEGKNIVPSQPPAPMSRRDRRRTARAPTGPSFSTGLMIRLAVVAWLIGGIGVVTWQKSINSVRASVAEGNALAHFRQGDLESTVQDLDKAIKLAPGVPSYYNNRAQVFLNYQLRPDDFTEPGCDRQSDVPYLVCLGVESLESNLESVDKQPFNYRARIAAGNSAFNLRLSQSAVDSYGNASNMVPNSWVIKNKLAESQVDIGAYQKALEILDGSLGITGDTIHSTRAFYLRGRALQGLGSSDQAIDVLKQGLSISYSSGSAQESFDLVREINSEQDVLLDIDYFDKIINETPQDAVALYLRGLAHQRLGNTESANSDIEKSYSLGFLLSEVRANRGYTRFKLGDINRSKSDLSQVVASEPSNALFNAYYGEFLMSRQQYALALNYLENATILEPRLGIAYLTTAKLYMTLGQVDSAEKALDSLEGLDLPSALDYTDRGEIYASLNQYALALSDLNEAIRINPHDARFYHARAKAYASKNNFESASADFNVAIQIDSTVGKYFLDRGVLYGILGETELSLADLKTAVSLGENPTAFFGRYGLALGDLDHAIGLLPFAAKTDRSLTNIFAILSDPKSALVDFDAATQIEPANSKYIVNRGVLYGMLGDTARSLADLATARSLGRAAVPRSVSYFHTYTHDTSPE